MALDLGLVPLKASEEVSNQQGGKTEGETTNEVKQDSGSEAVLEQGNSTGEDVTDDVVAPIIVEFPTPPPGKQQQQSNSEDNNDEGYVVVEDRTDLWSNLGVESSNTPKGAGSLPGPFKAKGTAAEKVREEFLRGRKRYEILSNSSRTIKLHLAVRPQVCKSREEGTR